MFFRLYNHVRNTCAYCIPLVAFLCFSECVEVVGEEVPQHGDADGKDPKDVEAPVFVPRGQQATAQPKGAVVDAETYKAYEEEFEVLYADLLFVALEGPHAVEYIVCGSGGYESDGVGHKLVDVHYIAQQVEYTEMYHHARRTDNAELYELEYERAELHDLRRFDCLIV